MLNIDCLRLNYLIQTPKMKQYFELYSTQKSVEAFSRPSLRMTKTLKECLQMETSFPGKPYGPADFKNSFSGLYRRGYLDVNINFKNKSKPGSWYVTIKGLLFLLSDSIEHTVEYESILLNDMHKKTKRISANSIGNLK